MTHLLRRWQIKAATILGVLVLAVLMAPQVALAGTTGNITGVVKDPAGKPLADVKVAAAAPSQSLSGTTDAHGYYSLVNLIPDTYTLSFQKSGYLAASVPGVTVLQDQTVTVNEQLQTELKTIANVTATGTSLGSGSE